MPEQLAVLWIALLAWAAWPRPSFAGLLGAYALGWIVVNGARIARTRLLRARWSRRELAFVSMVAAAPALAHAPRHWDAFVDSEGLDSIAHRTAARARLQATPSIAPPLVASDRPQTFYVHAPGARRVAIEFGGPTIDGAPLGQGLFRASYDPRRDGALRVDDGSFSAVLRVDGEPHVREMTAVHPLAHPRWLRSDGARAIAVSEETDELVWIDGNGEGAKIAVDDGPTDACFVGDRIAVIHRYGSTLLWIDATGAVIGRTDLGRAFALRIACEADRFAIAFGGGAPAVAWFDGGGSPVASSGLPTEAEWLAFGPGETLVFARRATASLHRVRRVGDSLRAAGTLRFGRPVVALGSDRSRAIVAVTDVRADGRSHLGNHFVQDELVTIDLERFAIVERRTTALRTPRQGSPGSVDRGVSPIGISLSHRGALVAFAGTDEVWRIEDRAPAPIRIALDEPLAAPISAVWVGDRIVVASAAYGAIGVFDASGERMGLFRLAPSDYDLIASGRDAALQRRIGERVFYESTRAGLSCQSCHLHGESDLARHNIGAGSLAATLDVRGLRGTPPYLRDGSYPHLGSLDQVAQELYRGYLRRQGGRVISLERYLADLPRPIPTRQLEGRDEDRERRGLEAFVRARCPLCHSFPAFTNLGQHPIAAIFQMHPREPSASLDTPSLFGLGGSAPYLADGRASSLSAVFDDHDPRRRHGEVDRLSEEQRADLVHFLEGL